MALRDYWKGSLKLSSVTCPIALYPTSIRAEKTQFRLQNAGGGDDEGEAVKDARPRVQGA